MEKKEVIERFCKLADRVNKYEFEYDVATDCFCGHNPIGKEEKKTFPFQFDEKAIKYIEQAVDYALCLI